MTNGRLLELASLNSLGALDGNEVNEFGQLLAGADAKTRQEIAAWETTAAQLAHHVRPLATPKASVKETLMRKIAERHATERALEGPGTHRFDHAQGIYTMFPDRIKWSKHPVPGVQIKLLTESKKRGYVTMLMKVDPGTIFPEHHHSGEEECYVLSGSIILNGKQLGVGVLHHGDEDSEHGTLSTVEGALLLLVVAKEDYIPPVEA
jgi:anti-sigma factor ChrR (cupin superfamily)